MTKVQENARFLLILNLLLQLLDAGITYGLSSLAGEPTNPSVSIASRWRIVAGFFYHKALAAALPYWYLFICCGSGAKPWLPMH
jgi:hypothetical protein